MQFLLSLPSLIQNAIVNGIHHRVLNTPGKPADVVKLDIWPNADGRTIVLGYYKEERGSGALEPKRTVTILHPEVAWPESGKASVRGSILVAKPKWGDKSVSVLYAYEALTFPHILLDETGTGSRPPQESNVLEEMASIAYDFLVHKELPAGSRQAGAQHAAAAYAASK